MSVQSNLSGFNSLVVGTININGGFYNKIDHINHLLGTENVDLLVVTETKIRSRSEVMLRNRFSGYKIYFVSEEKGKRMGVAVLLKLKFVPYVTSVKVGLRRREIEIRLASNKWIASELSVNCVVIRAIYAPSGSTTPEKTNFWKSMLHKIKKESANSATIVVGDCNVVPNHAMDKSSDIHFSASVTQFSKLMDIHVVDSWRKCNTNSRQYTYWKNTVGGLVETRIDHILCTHNIAKCIQASKILSPSLVISPDHKPIITEFWFPRKTDQDHVTTAVLPEISEEVVNLKNINKDTIDNYHTLIDQELSQMVDTDQSEIMFNAIKKVAPKAFGTKTIIRNKKNTNGDTPKEIIMLNRDASRLIKAKLAIKMWKVGSPTPLRICKLAFNDAKWQLKVPAVVNNPDDVIIWSDKVRKLCNLAQRTLHKCVVKHNDVKIKRAVEAAQSKPIVSPKAFFKAINVNKQSSKVPLTCVTEQDITHFDSDSVKKLVKNYWEILFSTKKMEDPDSSGNDKPWFKTNHIVKAPTQVQQFSSVLMEPFKISEVRKCAKSLSRNKAFPDGVPAELLMHLPEAGFKQITDEFNKILQDKVIPSSWKYAKLHLIHKGDNPALLKNYRPITITNVIYKLFMKLITKRLYSRGRTSKHIASRSEWI